MSINGRRRFLKKKPVHLVEFSFRSLSCLHIFYSFNYWVDACVTLMTNRKLCSRYVARDWDRVRAIETRNGEEKSKNTILKLELYRLISFSQPCDCDPLMHYYIARVCTQHFNRPRQMCRLALRTSTNVVMRNVALSINQLKYVGKTIQPFFFVIIIVTIKYVIIFIGCITYEKNVKSKKKSKNQTITFHWRKFRINVWWWWQNKGEPIKNKKKLKKKQQQHSYTQTNDLKIV